MALRLGGSVMGVALVLGCGGSPSYSSLESARQGHRTQLHSEEADADPLPDPPPGLFARVQYPGDLGPMNALVGADPVDGQRHPAIIWITGGFPPGGIDASAWSQPDVANEQTAQAYRHAGLVMMYPCFRGGCGNPGVQEDFYGEVDDVVSALAYLKTLSYVDPDRIYLGGHSTGGTLALLAAAATDDFAAVFALGPLGDPAHYGSAAVHYDLLDDKEVELRAPNNFLHTIRTPTWVIEGDSGSSNVISFVAMDLWNTNDAVQFALVEGADHFSVLHPVNTAIAAALKSGPAGGDIVVDESVLQEAWNSRAR